MNKTQWHFYPKIRIFIVSWYANIYSSGLVRNKTLSDNLHYAACKQSDSRVDPNARSLDSERLECAPIDRSGCLRTHEILLWVSYRTDIWLLWVLGYLWTTYRTRPVWN